jgi:putative drug exporter of the RND superfamily
MLQRYGRFVATRARLLLIIAAIAVIGAGALGAGAFGKLKSGGFADPAAPSTQAAQLIDTNFGGATNLVFLVHAKSGTVDDATVAAAGNDLAARLAAEPDVTGVVSYWGTGAPSLKSTDGRDALVVEHVAGDEGQVLTRATALIEKYAVDTGTVGITAGGEGAANYDVTTQVTKSLAIAESIAVPITMILLILAFGSLIAALLPLAIGLIAIVGTFAELAILGSITDVSIFAINLTTALGLGLGIDYALFIVSRFREQLAAGDEVNVAVARTVATAGRTIAFSAATVAAALAALLVFPLYFLRSFAYAGIGVVVIAVVAALVVAPALLAVLGHRVNSLRLPWSKAPQGAASPWWGRLAGAVMRRPAMTALPVVAALLFAASPLMHVSFGTPDPGVLPASAGSRHVADTLTDRFPGNASTPIDVVTAGPVAAGPLADYARTLSMLPGVVHVSSSAGMFTHGTSTPGDPSLGRTDMQRITVVSELVTKSDRAQDLVRAIRATPGPAGVRTLVGGIDAQLIDTRGSIGSRLPLAIGLIVLTTFIVLFLFTGSVIQPIRALLLNALSLGATLGILTWMFQDGHLSNWLGFTGRPMDTSMTVLLFCIAFGLSMDYEVFLMSRIKELHDRGADQTTAVTEGLARTGRIVSTAAGLLAVSFFAFGTSSVSFLQLFGIGTGIAILIDATLVRGILVPAAMKVLGPLAWWSPSPLRKAYGRVALREA